MILGAKLSVMSAFKLGRFHLKGSDDQTGAL